MFDVSPGTLSKRARHHSKSSVHTPENHVMTVENQDRARRRFIEKVAAQWKIREGSPMAGRILAYLLISDREAVSSAELVKGLGVSQGAISTATRSLLSSGMVKRVWVAGDRNHHFAAAEDPMGEMLRSGVPDLAAWQEVLQPEDALVAQLTDEAQTKLQNIIDYYTWIDERSKSLAQEWEEYRINNHSPTKTDE